MSTVDERVDTLECLVGQFIVQTNLALTKLSNYFFLSIMIHKNLQKKVFTG